MKPQVQGQPTISLDRMVQAARQRLHASPTFVRWLIVGSIGFLVNQLTLFLVYDSLLFTFMPAKGTDLDLVLFTHPDVKLLIASAAAVEAAIVSNFFWHERWTFRQRERRSATPVRFLKFNGITFGSPLIVLATVNTLTPIFGVSPYIANTIGVGLGALWNWVWDNHVIWRR